MKAFSAEQLAGLTGRLGGEARYIEKEIGDGWLELSAGQLADACRLLRDDPEYACDMLHLISGVDYLHTDPKKAAKATWEPHLEVLYHLSSTVHRHTLVLKVVLPRWQGGGAGSLPELPSVADIWRTADWHEREVYDLMGVNFVAHPGLRRILCPEDWDGHPLRRDYQIPEEYHGTRSPGSTMA